MRTIERMGIDTPRKLPKTLPPPRATPAMGFELDELALECARPTPMVPPELRLDGGELEKEESGLQPIEGSWTVVREQMQDAFAVCDYDRALFLAERYLTRDPADEIAGAFANECRKLVETEILVALAPLERAVKMKIPIAMLSAAHIDHRAGFLLSRIDGETSIEQLLDLAGMPRVDALRFLRDWHENGYIDFV